MNDEHEAAEELLKQAPDLRCRLEEIEKRYGDSQWLLAGITRVIGCLAEAERHPHEMVQDLTGLCGELLSASFAVYYHLEGATPCLWAKWHTTPDFEENDALPAFCDTPETALGGISVVRKHRTEDCVQPSSSETAPDLETHVACPVRCGESCCGLLVLCFPHGYALEARDRALLETMTRLVAVAERRHGSEPIPLLGNYRVSEVLSAAPLAISYFQDGRLRWANKAMLDLFGERCESDCLGTSPRAFYPSDDEYERVRSIIYRNLASGRLAEAEARFQRKDGSLFDGYIMAGSPDPSNPRKGTIMTISDVTSRKRADEALRQSEEEYRLLYEKANRAQELYRSLLNSCADAIVIYDIEGRAQYISDSFTQMFGWTKDDVIGKRIPFVPESEREVTMAQIYSLLSGHVDRGAFETRRYRKDRSILDVRISASRYLDHEGNPAGMLAILSDITESKRAEEALSQSEARLRTLSAQLLTAQESERKRVSRELHDGIGQSLTALRLKLDDAFSQRHSCGLQSQHETLSSLLLAIRGIIEEVHRISMDLRPSMLDDLGILATITWLVREFHLTCGGIQVEKEIRIEEKDVPESLKIVVFRVLQETFNNIAKHSRAGRVRLSLCKTDHGTELTVRDDGVGFDINEVLSPKGARRGLGIAGIRERIELSGGAFHMESAKGEGTMIRASWPDNAATPIRQ
ncbi:MAG: PAS domain S-box protein [Thermodesulfobacteriota bacterium]